MKIKPLIICILISCTSVYSQVGIGTTSPNNSSSLDIQSGNKGILIPRMSSSQRIAIVSPANSLMVFDTDASLFYYYSAENLTWFPVNIGTVKTINSTFYTLSVIDNGKVLDFTADTPIIITVPATLPTGFQVSITQAGLGSVILSATNGTTIKSRWGGTRSSGRWAKIGLEVRAIGSVVLSGDVQ
jgi:hypothetical protein